ncbi:MAG TPA: energy transducer TonB [Thiobacillaceae bacterium]|nr:energy transducer TonB [Thiobacillaceae bacterium]
MVDEGDYAWRRDTPWRRLPVTLPGALLVGLLGLWAGAVLVPDDAPTLPEPLSIDAQLIAPPQAPTPVRRTAPRQEPPLPQKTRPAGEPVREPPPPKAPASLAAPPAPTAEEWQLAAAYTPRNSKRYRNAWGQQVRSMMGTATEGPEQGQVRFRITIHPDGRLARVEELWSTSSKASELAYKAMQNLPRLPPTPTGKPLVFDQTISFLPYETGWPPSYQLDCLPEREPFKNPFAWDGSTPPQVVARGHPPPPPEGCPPDSTAATIEEEEQSMRRQMDQWRWGR